MSYARLSVPSLVILVWALVSSAAPVLAQDQSKEALDDSARTILQDDQLAEFRSQRMSLELIGRQESSFDTFSQAEGTDWYRWQVFQGAEPIGEEAFLAEAGRYQYAQEAASFHKDARHNLVAGVFLTILGGAAAYIGYNMEDYIDSQHGPSKGMMAAGITISGLGIGLGTSSALKTRRQWAPFSRAYDITVDYNRQLLEELQDDP